MIFEEALNQDKNTVINQAQQDVLNSLSAYLIKVMPFTYKNGYALNIMFNSKFNKLKDKQNIYNIIDTISNKYNGKVKSIKDNDNIVKIFF